MITATAVLKHARKYLGIQEEPRKSNHTPIGVKFGWNGVPWCAMTVCVVLRDAGFKIAKNASAQGLHDELVNYKWRKIKPANARPGDVIFYDWPTEPGRINHTGIVEGRTKDGRIIAIEGNTTLPNGNDGVARKIRALVCVSAVVRPPYAKTTTATKKTSAK